MTVTASSSAGLRLPASVGVLPEERERPQPLEVDLDVDVDLGAAGASDDLADTVDYGAVVRRRRAGVLAPATSQLLERLAGHGRRRGARRRRAGRRP